MTTQDKGREIKVYIIYNKRLDDVSEYMFEKKRLAQEKLRSMSYDSNPIVMGNVLKNYKILSATLIYKSPKK